MGDKSSWSSTITMSDYDLRPGGSLKLKGGVAEGGVVKKKKKKSKHKEGKGEPGLEIERKGLEKAISGDGDRSTSGSGRNSPAVVGGSNSGSKKTEAEKRFEERQKQRMLERVSKLAGKTHKDRVNEFNAKLESLSEHHDIPKVGPG